jgi:hypothetical protein
MNMERRKIQNKKRYLWAFIIGTIIFIIGFAITYSVAYFEYQRISSLQGPVSYEIFQDKLKFSLLGEDICTGKVYQEVSDSLGFQGGIIGDLEEKLGKDNENVIFRKQFYTLILLEHFELINTIKTECNRNINTILFFYSNEKEGIEASENVGDILQVAYKQNKGELFIYSIDMNLDSELVEAMVEKYNVTAPMKIIVNNNQSLDSLQNIEQIQTLLN